MDKGQLIDKEQQQLKGPYLYKTKQANWLLKPYQPALKHSVILTSLSFSH